MSEDPKHTLQPNSRHCFVCGLENQFGLKLRFYETGPGEVTAEYTVPDQFQGYPGLVHGGIGWRDTLHVYRQTGDSISQECAHQYPVACRWQHRKIQA
jgi:hypothetical protein